ncbi:hypothetical protein C0J52_16223 [Blattella germanica]|nr:hypothetical protein C0J52_16223 [Blattella germanica]
MAELELGLLQLHHPLPNTAKVLKGLFDSNSPNLHLACPRFLSSTFNIFEILLTEVEIHGQIVQMNHRDFTILIIIVYLFDEK